MEKYNKPYVIAEAGCNHKGEMEIAKELINVCLLYTSCQIGELLFSRQEK